MFTLTWLRGCFWLVIQTSKLTILASGGRNRKLSDKHPDTLETTNDLAVLYKELDQNQEAEKSLLEAVEGRHLKLGDTHPNTLESWNNLIELYEPWGRPEKAYEWRKGCRKWKL